MNLNLGCGRDKLAGYINVDRQPECSPDVLADLEVFPWPFENNSADVIVLKHILEHIGAQKEVFLRIIQEIYRVAKPGAKIVVIVPHPRSDAFITDPTHVRPILVETFYLFSKYLNNNWKETGCPATPLGIYLNVDFEIVTVEYGLTNYYANRLRAGEVTEDQVREHAMIYNNVYQEILIELRALKG